MTYIYDLNSLKTFWQLLSRSIKIALPTIPDRSINQMFWTGLNVFIFSYVMPHLGLSNSYQTFIVLTMPTSAAFFVCIHQIYDLLSNVTSNGGGLTYELTLPIPQQAVFIKYGLEYSFIAFMASLPLLPFGWVMIKCNISLTLISLIKFYFILFLTSLFGGFFALFITSIAANMFSGLDNMWVRVIFPMWFLGCFQFSWQDLYQISPVFAYLNLLNPLTYALEGGRASIALEHSSLNYEFCVLGLIVFTILLGWIANSKLCKRMDCL